MSWRGAARLGLFVAAVTVLGGWLDWKGCSQAQIVNVGPPGSGSGTGTGGGSVEEPDLALIRSTFRCLRVENPSGDASSCEARWSGGGVFDVLATRVGDGLTHEQAGVVDGAQIDPGPPGEGGGTWTIQLTDSGDVVASTSVVLDT